ncbi:hypothetical protein ADUPG1_001497 [Aduncisulcus paluster]|uniref:Uncharacterized protein n=1 Tax=Aduncisulcus paluster TaxID=2918883 RepID=A0ABQ5KD15_9EUKA|nr:hypothetical protein ADUPG1_001497 [Aduncisulcus paluster]
MVEASTLAVITDISDVPDLKSAENQEKAFNAVEQVFASTTAIGLYDSLSACKMERRLSIDALLRYNRSFREIRDRAPQLGRPEEVVKHFIDGLCSERLRKRVVAGLGDNVNDLPSAVCIAIVQLKKLVENELEHKTIESERIPVGERPFQCDRLSKAQTNLFKIKRTNRNS